MSKMLPVGVRCVVYSFLEFKTLLAKICKLNSMERKSTQNSRVLDQNKYFLVTSTVTLNGLKLALELATSISFDFVEFKE